MIKRDEKPPVPAKNFRRIKSERKLMILNRFQSLKRNRAERCNYFRIDEINLFLQKIRAVFISFEVGLRFALSA
jgi:hypothetical protein